MAFKALVSCNRMTRTASTASVVIERWLLIA
jgi:hypothetical protein